MRLICPNCGAQYEVDASLVPDTGRDVQCSNCGHGWFQHPDDPEAEVAVVPEDGAETPAPPPGDAPRRRRELDPEVADVLREEAERETAARKAESGDGLESQPDLGLDDNDERTADRSNAARARMARLRGLEDDTRSDGDAHSRGEMLPDVDEINSTLRGDEDREETTLVTDAPVVRPPRRGARLGFYLVLLICVIGIAVYALAPTIAAQVPQAEPYLVSYVAAVNDLRMTLNGWVDSGIGWVRGMIGSESGDA